MKARMSSGMAIKSRVATTIVGLASLSTNDSKFSNSRGAGLGCGAVHMLCPGSISPTSTRDKIKHLTPLASGGEHLSAQEYFESRAKYMPWPYLSTVPKLRSNPEVHVLARFWRVVPCHSHASRVRLQMHRPPNGGEHAHHRGVDHGVNPKHLEAMRTAVRKKASGLRLELCVATGVSWSDAAGDSSIEAVRRLGRSQLHQCDVGRRAFSRPVRGVLVNWAAGMVLDDQAVACRSSRFAGKRLPCRSTVANWRHSRAVVQASEACEAVAALMTQRPIHSGPNLWEWLLHKAQPFATQNHAGDIGSAYCTAMLCGSPEKAQRS